MPWECTGLNEPPVSLQSDCSPPEPLTRALLYPTRAPLHSHPLHQSTGVPASAHKGGSSPKKPSRYDAPSCHQGTKARFAADQQGTITLAGPGAHSPPPPGRQTRFHPFLRPDSIPRCRLRAGAPHTRAALRSRWVVEDLRAFLTQCYTGLFRNLNVTPSYYFIFLLILT